MNQSKHVSLLSLFFIVFSATIVSAQVSIETKDNTNCQGASKSCSYEGPSILINEISISPSAYDGSLVSGSLFTAMEGQGEWIELYNPNECDSVDISGYMLGSYNSVGGGGDGSMGMGYILPAGTVVPPNGFVIIRGANAPVPDPNAIDIIVTEFDNNLCWTGGATSRFWFQNYGSWFAFYDRNGIPQDAIRWGSPVSTDLTQRPCIPVQNYFDESVNSVPAFNDISGGSFLGSTNVGYNFVRIPDGGSWSSSQVYEFTSFGSCNEIGECKNGEGTSTCNGEATVSPSFGTAPYSFSWNDDLQQKSSKAIKLCPGLYTVVVTDSKGIQEQYTVEIGEDYFEIESLTLTQPLCEGETGSAVVNLFFDNPTTERIISYEWQPDVSFDSAATYLQTGSYTLRVDDGGCMDDTTFVIEHPPLDVAFSSLKSRGCVGDELSFQNYSTGVLENTSTCLWLLPDGTTTSNCQMQHTFDSAGSFPITLTITDKNNCEKSLTIPSMIDINEYPVVALGNDSVFCGNETAILNAPLGYSKYHWLPTNETTNSIHAFPVGKYTLTVTDENACETKDEIVLNSIPYPVVDLGPDTTFCDGGRVVLSIAPQDMILWNTGATNTSIVVSENGLYSVEVSNEYNCSASDEKKITVIPYPKQLILNKSDSLGCNGETKKLSIETDAELANWSNFSAGFETTINESGNYKITASNTENGVYCSIDDSIQVNFYSYPTLIPVDTFTYCFEFGANTTIKTATSALFYRWDGVQTNKSNHPVYTKGVYNVELYDHYNCKLNQKVLMEEKCPLRVYVPNAFTPEGGLNSHFFPVVPNYTELEFYIYNRWGQLIFTSNDPNDKWDGTYNGFPVQQDVYVWKIFVKGYNEHYLVEEFSDVGTVTLIR